MKHCCGCKTLKEFSEFNKCKTGKFGLHNHCRDCQKTARRKFYLNNIENEKQKSKVYIKSEQAIQTRRKYYSINKKEVLRKNRGRRCTPKARQLANKARNFQYHNNLSFRISVNLRSRIRQAIAQNKKCDHTKNLLGCTLDEFKAYLESKFQAGMTWENYSYRGWHIDHIRPCSSFDLSDTEQQRQCFHYTNLQPMWCLENIGKGSKIIT